MSTPSGSAEGKGIDVRSREARRQADLLRRGAVTTGKRSKQLVRERMLRTGERYTVARAHVAAQAEPPAEGDWELRGGVHADTAGAWDAAAAAWEALIGVAFGADPELERLRGLMIAAAAAVARGDAAAAEAARLAGERWALQERLDADFPVDPGALFARLHDAVAAVHAAETAALAALASVVED